MSYVAPSRVRELKRYLSKLVPGIRVAPSRVRELKHEYHQIEEANHEVAPSRVRELKLQSH